MASSSMPYDPSAGSETPSLTSKTSFSSFTSSFTSTDVSYPPNKQTLLQGFEWYVPPDKKHWKRLESILPTLARLGVKKLHIPPACKAFGPESVGYDIYDLFDLGEFKQKNCVATKYGTKSEIVSLAHMGATFGVGIIFDVVISHKAGADAVEPVRAVRVEQLDRNAEIGEFKDISAWTKFDYEARRGKHSEFTWNKDHFNGVDYDENTKEAGVIHRFEGKQWADADPERGNYDYLMFANVDLSNHQVRAELFHWIEWLNDQMPLAGLRLDAIKHMSTAFVKDFVAHAKKVMGRHCLLAGEYWVQESDFLVDYAQSMNDDILLYDIQLVHNFKDLSWSDTPDLRTVFDGTLARAKPQVALTFVVNHDTQEGQTSECLVAPWFVPLAYSIILLHASGGTPVVFYGDLYGSFGPMGRRPAGVYEPADLGRRLIPKMMLARKSYAYGPQSEYFDQANCVGFTRHGDAIVSGGAGLAVLMTSSCETMIKTMFVGTRHAGERWTDLLAQSQGTVEISADGVGVFNTASRSVSVWVDVAAAGRADIDASIFDHDIYRLEG